MEIEIPDLQDLEFLGGCTWCRGNGKFERFETIKGSRKGNWVTQDPCPYCQGKKIVLTPVGERLREALQYIKKHYPGEVQ